MRAADRAMGPSPTWRPDRKKGRPCLRPPGRCWQVGTGVREGRKDQTSCEEACGLRLQGAGDVIPLCGSEVKSQSASSVTLESR